LFPQLLKLLLCAKFPCHVIDIAIETIVFICAYTPASTDNCKTHKCPSVRTVRTKLEWQNGEGGEGYRGGKCIHCFPRPVKRRTETRGSLGHNKTRGHRAGTGTRGHYKNKTRGHHAGTETRGPPKPGVTDVGRETQGLPKPGVNTRERESVTRML